MKDKITLKPGAIVMLAQILILEIATAVILVSLSFIIDFLALYENLKISGILSSNLFGIIVFAVLQLVYVISIFLRWNFESYEVYKDKVIHKKGVFFKSNDLRPFKSLTSIRQREGALARWLNYSSIELEDANSGQTILIPHIAKADEEIENIQKIINVVEVRSEIKKKDELSKLIKEGESKNVEFKASLRWDIKKGAVNKEIELVIMRSIVAFMNTEGGKLLIGIGDNGKVVGLENDFKSVKRKNSDGFENHIMTLFTNYIGSEHASNIDIKFEQYEKNTICILNISRSDEPIFFKNNNDERLYVRAGNSTRELNAREAFKYIRTTFPDYTG